MLPVVVAAVPVPVPVVPPVPIVVPPVPVVVPPVVAAPVAAPVANRLDEMTDEQWDHYRQRVTDNWLAHRSRAPANLAAVAYLYHATGADVLPAIRQNGLLPRNPTWKPFKKTEKVPRFDASKDGYLSMATNQAGAGAMGGLTVLLRMQVRADIGNWDFRKVGVSTEVRTTLPIPADRLQYSEDNGRTWHDAA